MTRWLTSQVRTLGTIAGLALFLGFPGSAHAEPQDAPSKAKAAHHAKKPHGKRTAQVKKSDKKTHADKGDKAHADKGDKAHADKGDKSDKAPAAKKKSGKGHGKTAQSHTHPTRRDTPALSATTPAATPAAKDEHDDCVRDAVEIGRTSGEEAKFSLTRCKGKPADKALERLAVLMRPFAVDKPASLPAPGKPDGELAHGIHTADPGLLSRLQAIATEFPGKKLTLVSGYRPSASGAYHRHGKAIDLRVEGVKTEELATFCRSLVDTGCGYYPNSGFVHIDVRAKGSGHTYWIDSAGPGEAPHFVSSWPPADDDDKKAKGDKHAPHDDTSHADVKKKPGRGSARADRDNEE